MRVEESIVALCDRWWTELSHSKTATMRSAAEEWMGFLGWRADAPVYLEGAACGYVVTNVKRQRIAFYFTMPGELDTPSVVIEKGLDYCETTLLLVGEGQLKKYDYIVITDLNRTYLYDAASDELLLFSDTPQLFVDDVMESLMKEEVDSGVLDELRRDPASFVARQLRTWWERWTVTFLREPYGSETVADAIMDRMLVLRFLYDHSICETPGWSYRGRFTELIASSYEESPAITKEKLIQLMDDMYGIWNCDLYRSDESIARIVTKSNNVVMMIQELALMAKTKFTVPTILESFNYGDASEKARVRLVPEASEEREQWLGKLGRDGLGNSKLEVDVLDEGYRVIAHWFNRLLEVVESVAAERDLTSYAEENLVELPVFGEAGEMDLFTWGSDDVPAQRPTGGTEIDLPGVALQKLFYIWTATDRQRRTARIILLMHLIEAYESGDFQFGVFPKMETAFGERPALLDVDKRRIYRGRSESVEEWDAV